MDFAEAYLVAAAQVVVHEGYAAEAVAEAAFSLAEAEVEAALLLLLKVSVSALVSPQSFATSFLLAVVAAASWPLELLRFAAWGPPSWCCWFGWNWRR